MSKQNQLSHDEIEVHSTKHFHEPHHSQLHLPPWVHHLGAFYLVVSPAEADDSTAPAHLRLSVDGCDDGGGDGHADDDYFCALLFYLILHCCHRRTSPEIGFYDHACGHQSPRTSSHDYETVDDGVLYDFSS